MRITMTIKKDADVSPRCAEIEVDEALVERRAWVSETQHILDEIKPVVEAMLALKPEDQT